MTHEILLDVRQLTYRYGQRIAIDAVGFSIHRGEVVGLLGPNGAGKTTTISCIAGLLADWQGHMEFQGRPFLPARYSKDRGKLGFIPQELAVYKNLTAEENLRFFADLSGVSPRHRSQRVTQQLELSGLADRRGDLVSTFSGGMQRRLNLAVGLLHSPALVLLDEPTVGVDPQSRNHLFETLLRLKQSGMSLLYTTHYMEEAQRLCDRIAIMNEGRIVAIGTSNELAMAIELPEANLEQVFLHLTGCTLRDD